MLVTRYLFKNLFQTTLFVALTLTLVIWLTQSLKLLELVANSDAPPGLLLKMIGLSVPKFLETVLPLSLAGSILFVYNRFIMDNELVVMRACGMDHIALAKPALLLAAATSAIVLLLSAWLTPLSAGEVINFRQAVKTQYSAFLLREGVFNTFGDKFTVYLRGRSSDGEMTGLMIHDMRNKDKPPVTIIAKKGRVVMEGDTPNIIVSEGMRQQFDPSTGAVSKLYFSRYTIEIKGLDGGVQQRWRGEQERSMRELLHPDLADKRDADNRLLFLVEAQRRLIAPCNTLAFAVVALASILLGPFNRRGQSRRILAGAAVIVAVQALSLFAVSAAKKQFALTPFIYINTGVPIALSFYLLHPAGEAKMMALLRRWNQWSGRKYA